MRLRMRRDPDPQPIQHNGTVRFAALFPIRIACVTALLLLAGRPAAPQGQPAPSPAQHAPEPAQPPMSPPPMSPEDKANMLSDQIGKLMVKCVNLLTAQDPLSLDYCKQQRDLADQYPPHFRLLDRMMAHDEYGIALAAFAHRHQALEEFNREVSLAPQAVKPGSAEWSTAYWHRAMIYSELGDNLRADRDYRAAEASLRQADREQGKAAADPKLKKVLRQHAALLARAGRNAEARQLLAEAAK